MNQPHIKLTPYGIEGYGKIKIQYIGRNPKSPWASVFNSYTYSIRYSWKQICMRPIEVFKAIIKFYSQKIEICALDENYLQLKQYNKYKI